MKFAKASAVPVLPSYIWVHELAPADAAVLNAELIQVLDTLVGPRPPGQSMRPLQTDQTLHRYRACAPLVALIEKAVGNVLEALAVDLRAFEITGCWANYSQPGTAHLPHHHANNFLSGVYYVLAPGGADSITFHDPRPQREIIEPVYTRVTPFNQMTQDVKVTPGSLVLFPGWLTHSVRPNKGEGERLSVAFNIMFSDFAGTVSRPRWQGTPFKRPPET